MSLERQVYSKAARFGSTACRRHWWRHWRRVPDGEREGELERFGVVGLGNGVRWSWRWRWRWRQKRWQWPTFDFCLLISTRFDNKRGLPAV